MDTCDLFLALTVDTRTSDHVVQERNMTASRWPGRRWMCVCVHAQRVMMWGAGGWMRLLRKEEIRPVSDIFDTTSNHLSPSTAPVDHYPSPSLPQGSWPADGQSSKWQWQRPPSMAADGALRFDYTKLWPHKMSWCATAKFPSCGFSLRHG